jgi:hypothetical protein
MDCEQFIQAIHNNKDLVDYLSALLVPIIAILGATIAFQQWQTNAKRLRHELFDRRYEQFLVVRDFLGSIMASGKSTPEEQLKYLSGTRGIRFVFDKEIAEFVNEEIWLLANELQCLASMIEGEPVGEKRTNNINRQSEIKIELHEMLKSLEEKFAKYLQLEH